MYTSFFNNSSLDYDKKNKSATIWAFSKNVALFFDKPFAFKLPVDLSKTKYSIYVVTEKTSTTTLKGVLVWPTLSNAAVKIDKTSVNFESYDYYEFKKLELDKTYLFDSTQILEEGNKYFDNNGLIGIVFRFETEYSRLDLQEFYFEDEIKITDMKLDANDYELSWKAESFFMKNNITNYIELNGARREITPKLDAGVYKYTLTELDKGLTKINIFADSGYKTQISKTLFVKNGETTTITSDKSTGIVLYSKDDKNFNTNGEGILKDIINVKVSEVLNGIFNLDLELFNTDRLSNVINTGCVIKCPVSKTKDRQLFKVRTVTRIGNKVKVFAQHIAIAKLIGNYVTNEFTLNTNAVTATNEVMSNSIFPTEIEIDGSVFGENKDVNITKGKVLDLLINNTDSIKNIFGCDFEFDNYKLKVFEKRGKRSQNTLRDNKNIVEIEEDINDLDICTAIIPYSSDGITIPEVTVTSSNMTDYDNLYIKEYTFQDILLNDVYDTEEKVQEALRKACIKLFNVDKIDIPISSYNVSVKELKNKFNDTLELGDEILCRYKKMNLDLIGRVEGREFNPLTMENTRLDINFRKKSLGDILNLKSIDETIKSKRDFSTKKYVNDLINEVVESLDNNNTYTTYSVESLNNENLQIVENNIDMDYRLSQIELGL